MEEGIEIGEGDRGSPRIQSPFYIDRSGEICPESPGFVKGKPGEGFDERIGQKTAIMEALFIQFAGTKHVGDSWCQNRISKHGLFFACIRMCDLVRKCHGDDWEEQGKRCSFAKSSLSSLEVGCLQKTFADVEAMLKWSGVP